MDSTRHFIWQDARLIILRRRGLLHLRLTYFLFMPRVQGAIDLLSVRMETGVGEALALVLAEESAVAQHNVVDFIS